MIYFSGLGSGLVESRKADDIRSIKLANFCGRGFVTGEENQPIILLNHVIRPILLFATSYDISFMSKQQQLAK